MKQSDDPFARLRRRAIHLTLGGEPSYVPLEPDGLEWSVTALGPTKLSYARTLAKALLEKAMPGGISILSPGKTYPGEPNPRWALKLLANRDGSPMVKPSTDSGTEIVSIPESLAELRRSLIAKLRIDDAWIEASDPAGIATNAWVLPLDHEGTRWFTEAWVLPEKRRLELTGADGPAGLRLPLGSLPPNALRRALVLETIFDLPHVFIPPLFQRPFLELIGILTQSAAAAGFASCAFDGYVPDDEGKLWLQLGVTPDPGVIEINLPPCESAKKYAWWLEQLERAATVAGLCSYKRVSAEETVGTGGGNHLLFGGPSLEENPFFTHPQWVTSILRYWQHHPSLSYLFTGSYVGASSQAPRPDESSRELYDLEMAYQFLEQLEPGKDHRYLVSETLRHLHIDRAGNTHRSETSFDKFWNTSWEGGCRGLIEFRAIETFPSAQWMSAIAFLWSALAAHLFEKKFTRPLVDHGARLHDFYFLPTPLWNDFERVLADLKKARFPIDQSIFQALWEYRFPSMLEFSAGGASLVVRKGMEGWPLLCETPLEGGNTSRFVDTSIERLEFAADRQFTATRRIYVQGRALPLRPKAGAPAIAGLRYRRTSLYPSLHPGISPQMPLYVTITDKRNHPIAAYRLDSNCRHFQPCRPEEIPLSRRPCQKLQPELITYDLRLP